MIHTERRQQHRFFDDEPRTPEPREVVVAVIVPESECRRRERAAFVAGMKFICEHEGLFGTTDTRGTCFLLDGQSFEQHAEWRYPDPEQERRVALADGTVWRKCAGKSYWERRDKEGGWWTSDTPPWEDTER